ncbi:FixH family protein [Microbulbifer sp.]|uniref:FixH family protein n=1 Tax=Microbulbifer sp. TaxID=1908541 RepID=UPI003F305A51
MQPRFIFLTAALLLAMPVFAGESTNSSLMLLGGEMLRSAEALQAESVTAIRHGNSLRKTLNQLRVKLRSLPEGEERAALGETIDLFAGEIPRWQQQAASLRERGLSERQRALALLETGYREIWQPHIRLSGPLQLDGSDSLTSGHNARIRSVHPSKLNMNVAPGDRAAPADMSLAVPAASGQNIPGELDLRSFQISRELAVFAHVEPETGNSRVPLNEIHSWKLMLSRLDGEPLGGAEIEIEGHMPGHVHGLPTQPRVTGEVEPGVYRVQGVKFQMTGWWVMTFKVSAGPLDDAVTFNIRL